MYRYFLFIILMLFPGTAHAVINYQLDLTLYPEQQRLTATALVTPDSSFDRRVELRLSPDCQVLGVQQAGRDLAYRFDNALLKLNLVNREPFKISYQGRFNDQVANDPIHNEDPSYGVAAVISPAGTFLSSAANWYPQLATDSIEYHIKVSAPAGTEAITSGQRLERETAEGITRSSWKIEYPLNGLSLSAGQYQVFEDLNGPVPIYAYFYPSSAQLAQTYLQESRNYLNLYEELFGIYPFDKFAIVENFFPTGYGFPSWTLLGSSVIRLPFIVKTSLGHEMAHSWWGTGVRVDYSQGNWAEGLTTYVADYLYKERQSAADALEYRLKILRDYASLVNSGNDFPVARFLSRSNKASQSIGYGKTAMIFHMLRQEVGDEIFWCGLRELAQQNLFKEIGWDDFSKAFSAATNRNLEPFFKQWLRRTEGPRFSLQNVRRQKNDSGYSVSGELVQSAPTYELTVTLQVEHQNGLKQFPVSFSGRSHAFSFPVADLPLALVADPGADLFRILEPEEIPPTVNAIRGSSGLLAVKADRLVPSPAATDNLLGALRKSDLQVINSLEVAESELSRHDLLIFGWSDRLNPGIVSGDQIRLAGETSTLDGNSTFIVQQHPLNKARTAAWFLSADRQSDAVAARKIPHYGKYSYLLFDGPTNRQKGTFPPHRSPLRVEFEN